MNKNTLFAMLLIAVPAGSAASVKTLEIKVNVKKSGGDAPMVVMWLETDTGKFVKTLQMFCKKKKYYKKMLAWKFRSRKKKSVSLDAVTGATIKWGASRSVSVPVELDGKNILDGTYVLRFESRKDKGKHYRKFKIPLPKDYAGGKHCDAGYVREIEISVTNKTK